MKKTWITAALASAVLCAACTRPSNTTATNEQDTVTAAQSTQTTASATTPDTTTATTPPFAPTQTTDISPQIARPMMVNEDKASVRRIGAAEAKELVDSGAVTVIDVRDAESYAAAHIPGALNMPLPRIQSEPNAIPRGKPVLAYCT